MATSVGTPVAASPQHNQTYSQQQQQQQSSSDVQKHSVHTLVFRSLKRTHDMFLSDFLNPVERVPEADDISRKAKLHSEYGLVAHLEAEANLESRKKTKDETTQQDGQQGQLVPVGPAGPAMPSKIIRSDTGGVVANIHGEVEDKMKRELVKRAPAMVRPNWHAPWKLYRVISGHLGWVRCVAFEPNNEWFVTGAADRVIKIWDLASGTLKLSLTGHVSGVRGVGVSKRHPYLFSCGDDKQVKCWDLEYNKVIRHYHGHLSACQGLDIHPTLDVLATCSRDSTARLWDIRTKAQIHCLTGHTNTVAEVRCQESEPQIITGSHDATVRLWDIVAGKTRTTLTNHKKSVRAVALHPTQYTFASGSADNIKQWKFPDGVFLQNMAGHNAIVNTLAANRDNVLVSAADNGSMHFWDWKSGYNFQRLQAPVQPGSIDSEAGIFSMAFDQSGSRLITTEADKTIKCYREDTEATEESHPINWKPGIQRKPRY